MEQFSQDLLLDELVGDDSADYSLDELLAKLQSKITAVLDIHAPKVKIKTGTKNNKNLV